MRSRFGGWAETQRWGGIREVETFCGGTEQKHIRGNSKSPRRYKGGWLFIIIRYYAKKNFSHNIYYDIIAARSCILFVWVVGWGMRFRTPPKVRTRFIAFALWGVGGNAEVGWTCVSRCRIASQHLVAFCLFGWSGGGCVFEHPPKCGRGSLRSRFGGWAKTQRRDGRVSQSVG